MSREAIGWALAALGGLCAVAAAWVKGGAFEALTAAGAAFTSASVAWGFVNKPPAAK